MFTVGLEDEIGLTIPGCLWDVFGPPKELPDAIGCRFAPKSKHHRPASVGHGGSHKGIVSQRINLQRPVFCSDVYLIHFVPAIGSVGKTPFVNQVTITFGVSGDAELKDCVLLSFVATVNLNDSILDTESTQVGTHRLSFERRQLHPT